MFSEQLLRAIRLTTNSICKDTMNILILQEKMGDNIKKMANLFVISDFCSIWIDSHNPLNFSVLCHFL